MSDTGAPRLSDLWDDSDPSFRKPDTHPPERGEGKDRIERAAAMQREEAAEEGTLAACAQARCFLDRTFAELPGRIEIRAFDRRTGRLVRLTPEERFHGEWPGPANPASAARAVARLLDESTVFVGIVTRDSVGRGGKTNLVATRAFWVDLDSPEAIGALPDRLKGIPAPSFSVLSGSGVHLYWLLDEPVIFEGPSDLAQHEAKLRGLADYLGGDRSATDASRVLRVPGTWNFKHTPPRPTVLVDGARA